MTVAWEAPRRVRPMPPGSLLVDRDRFDALLVDRAVELGATLLTPATALRRRRHAEGWAIEVDGDRAPVLARFAVDASGRPSSLRRVAPGQGCSL